MKVRVKFSKEGPIRFIGHLDVMRYFQKAIRRADIDIAYSTGFSPHQMMSFASPLSVGHESEGEYFDMELLSMPSEEDVKKRLNAVMADGIQILDVYALPEKERNAMASVAAADYRVSFSENVSLPDDFSDRLWHFLSRDTIFVTKQTKRSEAEINLKERIFDYRVLEHQQVYLLLDAGSGSNIKPGFVMECFFKEEGLDLPFYPFRIRRLETYRRFDDGSLHPLIER